MHMHIKRNKTKIYILSEQLIDKLRYNYVVILHRPCYWFSTSCIRLRPIELPSDQHQDKYR